MTVNYIRSGIISGCLKERNLHVETLHHLHPDMTRNKEFKVAFILMSVFFIYPVWISACHIVLINS